MKMINMTNQKIGRLTIIERDYEYVIKNNIKKQMAYWKCKCDCGTIITARGDHLRKGTILSCGCLRSDKLTKDISNQKFGKLTTIYKTNKKDKCGHIIWKCKCDCGNTCEVSSSYLINNHVQSCGCINSIGESNIQRILEQNKINFIKEKYFLDFKYSNNTYPKYDFYLPDYNRLIEFDGEQHYMESPLFNRKVSLTEQQKRDKLKNEYALSHNISLVRIPYWEKNNITLEMIVGNQYLFKPKDLV